MPTNHDALLAFPIDADASQEQSRSLTVKRMPYVLTDSDDPEDLVSVDPDTGAVIWDILFLGRVFHFDPADLVSPHDGTTILVTFSGGRYKLADGSEVVAWSVLDNTLATPPGAPSLGDAYLVAAGATGAWSGKDDYVAVFTSRGWEFINFGPGRFIYVEAGTNIDTYYHRKANGDWVAGFGTNPIADDGLSPGVLIGRPVRWFVENQTTNAPPGSPSIGDTYIIGPSPTGAWAGNAGKVAMSLNGSTFFIFALRDGELAYDKSLDTEYRYSETAAAWVSAAGAIIDAPAPSFTTSGSTTTGGSGNYSWSDTVAPTSSQAYAEDSATISHAARRTGARLRFHYSYVPNSGAQVTLALFRDAEANALDWFQVDAGGNQDSFQRFFETTAPDTSSHTYKVRSVNMGAGVMSGVTRRRFYVEEFA